MSKTNQEKLDEVEEAITQALASQELNHGGDRGSVRRPDLKVLFAERERLTALVRAESGRGIAVNHGIPRRN